MKLDPRSWNTLQNRWASGEPLDAVEEQARRDVIASDPLASREHALFEELRTALDDSSPAVDPALVARVHVSAGLRPSSHLRLVSGDSHPGSTPPPPRARSRTPRYVAGLTGAALAAAGVAAFMHWNGETAPPRPAPLSGTKLRSAHPAPRTVRSELVFASGEVLLGAERAAVGVAPLSEGQELATAQGHACVTIDPSIDVCLGEHSAIRLESLLESHVRVRVQRGTAIAALSKRLPGQRFSLEAQDVSAAARGTVFAVQVRTPQDVQISVVEGTVDVATKLGESEPLFAHSRLELDQRRDLRRRRSISRGDEARLSSLLTPRRLWQSSNLGVLEVSGAEPGARATLGAEGPLTLPFRSFVPAGLHELSVMDARGGALTRQVEIRPGETVRVDVNQPASAASADNTAPRTAPNASALLERARRQLAQGQTRAALSSYQLLLKTHPGTAEAKTVLVTVGKLQLDLNAPGAALATFDSYLKSGGPLSPEALAGKIRALRMLGRVTEEHAAIEAYLRRYPNGFAASTLKRRLDQLKRRPAEHDSRR